MSKSSHNTHLRFTFNHLPLPVHYSSRSHLIRNFCKPTPPSFLTHHPSPPSSQILIYKNSHSLWTRVKIRFPLLLLISFQDLNYHLPVSVLTPVLVSLLPLQWEILVLFPSRLPWPVFIQIFPFPSISSFLLLLKAQDFLGPPSVTVDDFDSTHYWPTLWTSPVTLKSYLNKDSLYVPFQSISVVSNSSLRVRTHSTDV